MSAPKCSDEEFINLFRAHGAAGTARAIGTDVRNVYSRRRNLEKIHGPLESPNVRKAAGYERRAEYTIQDGCILVGSDAHYWPGEPPTAHRALVKFCPILKPLAVVMNGDVFDGARAGRHPEIMWSNPPTIREELDTVDERLEQIRAAAGDAELFWTLGNHCQRFESKASNTLSEFKGVEGMRLADHFPHWRMCWSVWVNDNVVIKHRFKGGIHATHNNALWAGKTMVTGHLHSLKVTPFTDYNGIRYGIDTGTLADLDGEQFDYGEDNPRNHRSGFIVLTFRNGELLWPEIVAVVDKTHVQFRGEIIEV